jgi:mannose-6-phosphate isomerase-like protein (cupin superfamily)
MIDGVELQHEAAWPAEVVNLAEKFGLFDEQWSPRVVGALNGQRVKLAKIQGEFVWHAHEDEDELFLVVKGTMALRLRETTENGEVCEREVTVGAGEFFIVQRGVEHCPAAAEECHVLLFEPAKTSHTGERQCDRTVLPADQSRL